MRLCGVRPLRKAGCREFATFVGVSSLGECSGVHFVTELPSK